MRMNVLLVQASDFLASCCWFLKKNLNQHSDYKIVQLLLLAICFGSDFQWRVNVYPFIGRFEKRCEPINVCVYLHSICSTMY